MYASISSRLELSPQPPSTAASSSAASHGMARRTLTDQVDRRGAAVAVLEHQLHEAAAGGEVARADPAAEGKAALPQLRLHLERPEAAGGRLDRLESPHARVAVNAEDGEVPALVVALPVVARLRVRGQDRVVAVGHEIQRGEEVAPARL